MSLYAKIAGMAYNNPHCPFMYKQERRYTPEHKGKNLLIVTHAANA